jgi:IS1 family transposase
MKCLKCLSDKIVKYGKTHYGKQRYKCKDCNRQFVENPRHQPISDDQRNLIDKLLLERISLEGIVRVTGVSKRWLQYYINQKYYQVEKKAIISEKKKGKLILQLDELWSFIINKKIKVWIWIALDSETREIVGLVAGDRSQETAKKLWDNLPPVYRQCAVFYTDFWEAYAVVFPSKRHKAVDKSSGKTSYIERFNNTLRQRVSRLVRKTLSFSKKFENHLGSLWYFVHDYNSRLN